MGLEYEINAQQIIPNISTASAKHAQIYFDSSPGQSEHLIYPAELYLTAFAACILKNVERFSEKLKFRYKGAVREEHLEPVVCYCVRESGFWTASK